MPLSLEYIAGLFDGEGCIMLSQFSGTNGGYTQLRVNVNMANELIPTELHNQFGGSLMEVKVPLGYKPQLMWRAVGTKAGRFLETLLPYLVIKKKQAELGIEFQKRRKGLGNWRSNEEIEHDKLSKELMHILNKGGG